VEQGQNLGFREISENRTSEAKKRGAREKGNEKGRKVPYK